MQTSIFLPLILMAGTGGDGADATTIVAGSSAMANAQARAEASATVSSRANISPANIMPNSHFRSQAGFQNDIPTGAQSGAEESNQADLRDNLTANTVPQEIFEGCRPAVLDPRLSSRILFDNRLAALEGAYGASEVTNKDQIYVSHCGDEFVLFSRVTGASLESEDALYLRFQEGTFELVGQHWG